MTENLEQNLPVPLSVYKDTPGRRNSEVSMPEPGRGWGRKTTENPGLRSCTELPFRYTTIENALASTIKPGSQVYIQGGDNTPPDEVFEALVKIGNNLMHQTGSKNPVIEVVTGIHTGEKIKWLDPDKPGSLHLRTVFAGAGVRQAVQKGISAEPMRDSTGHLVHLDAAPRYIWEDNGLIDPDVLVIQASPAGKNGMRSLGTEAAVTAELLDRNRKKRIDGQKPSKVILIENPHIPSVGKGDGQLHYGESDYAVVMDHPLSEHGHAKEKKEAEVIAYNIVSAVQEELQRKENLGKDVDMQAGIGAGPNIIIPGIADICAEQGRKMGIVSEVVTTSIPPLIEAGKVETPVITTFTLGLAEHMAAHGECYDIRRTGAINNLEALKKLNKERGDRVFLAVNWGVEIDAATGDVKAAQVPQYKDGRIVDNKVQGGHGGQRVMMQAGHELGASVIGIQALRRIKEKSPRGEIVEREVSGIVLDTNGAETTTPAGYVTIYATEYGTHRRLTPAGDPSKDIIVRQDNVRGLISIAAPQFRDELTAEAIQKGLLPAPAETTVYQNLFMAPYVVGLKQGIELYRRVLGVYYPYLNNAA